MHHRNLFIPFVSIMPVLAGHDTIAQAQSGTGKTATFSIAVLQQIDLKQNKCQALILAPTRELAQQIQKVARALGDFLNVTSHACVGGTLVRDDVKILREGVQIVVGTPGRVYGTNDTQDTGTPIGGHRANESDRVASVSNDV